MRSTVSTCAAPVLALALATAFACLPDLQSFPSPPEPIEAGAPAASACGDGFIEPLDNESCDPGDASAPGCETCQIRCEGVLDPTTGHCYFSADAATYAEAMTTCAAQGAHVATFASQHEIDLVDGDGYWVGLTREQDAGAYRPDVSEPGWPLDGGTCPGCFALGADDAGTFPVYENDAGEADPKCLVAAGGRWLRASCTQRFPTLCEREPAGERVFACGGLLCASFGSKRYVIWQSPTLVDQARDLCKNTYDGGSLVMFDSAEERELLVREMAHRFDPPVFTFWIGVSADGGTWSWDDGKSRPIPWANDEPKDAGTVGAFVRVSPSRFDTQLVVSEAVGDQPHSFVCQRPPE
jgi:hypothetical protein